MGSLDKWYVFGRDPGFDEGMRSYQTGAYADAALHLNTFLSKRPTDPSLIRLAKLFLADSFAHLGAQAESESDFAGAAEFFDQAIVQQPNFSDLHYSKAKSLARSGDVSQALVSVNEALRISPSYVAAHLLRAILHYSKEECEIAIGSVIDALERQPDLDGTDYHDFATLHNAGNNEEAVSYLWKMLETCGDSTKGLIQQARELSSEGKHEEACDQFLRLIEIVPNYADVRCRYGESLLELDKVEAAKEQFEAALSINPRYADALAAMGVAYLREDNSTAAMDAFKQVLEWNPEHPVASEQLRRLRR